MFAILSVYSPLSPEGESRLTTFRLCQTDVSVQSQKDLRVHIIPSSETELKLLTLRKQYCYSLELGFEIEVWIDTLQMSCNDCLLNFRHTSSKLKSW